MLNRKVRKFSLIKKMIFLISVFLMGTFSVQAIGYNYKYFYWDDFTEMYSDYWTGICENEEDKEKCTETVLKSQKKFYTKLYKLLGRYESNGIYIQDEVIIATIYYNLTPDSFGEGEDKTYSNWFESVGGWFESIWNKITGDDYYTQLDDSSDDIKVLLRQMVDENGLLSEDHYWNYLINSDYFDKQPHIQNKFAIILDETNHKKMSELSSEEYENYSSDIIDVRTQIVEELKQIIELFHESHPESLAFFESNGGLNWWPIGSAETMEKNGVIFASESPIESIIIHDYEIGSYNGIDIALVGEYEKVNIIAIKDGIVNKVVTGCNTGELNCGSGYGNYVTISHNDGSLTLYGFLSEVLVSAGESVKQGQLIGYMGDTGNATTLSLHFEIKIGSISSVNPHNYIDINNPRPKSSSVELINGGDNMQSVCLTLKNAGLSDNGVAGLLTNINHESGFNYDAIGDGGTSYGLCQWHNSRWTDLKNFAPNNWKSIDGQISFLLYELQTGYGGVYNMILSGSSSVYNITYSFCHDFERPANTNSTCTNRANSSSPFEAYVNNGCN